MEQHSLSPIAVLWERGASKWSVHLAHGFDDVIEVAAGPWHVDVYMQGAALSRIVVHDMQEGDVWPREDLNAAVCIGDEVIEVALRPESTERVWTVEHPLISDLYVADDGQERPRLTGILLLGDYATATIALLDHVTR